MKKAEPEFQKILRLISQFKTEVESVHLFHKKMYRKTCNYVQNPENSILTNMYMPNEIFYAMGLTPVFTEYITGTMATLKKSSELIDISEERIQTTGFCSYITNIIGIFENEHLPVPRFLILPSEICEDTPKIFEYLYYKYKKQTDFYFIDIPYSSDSESVNYIASQIEGMVEFLEKHTGKKLDHEKLEQTFKLSNEAKKTGDKIKNIRKISPPLISGRYGIYMAGVVTLFGTQDAVEILENMYNEMKKNKKNNNYKTYSNRLYWVHLFPPYASKLVRYLERDLGSAIVGEEIFYIPKDNLDIDSPYKSLARKIISHPVHGSIESRKDHILKEVIEHNVAGVINFSPNYCRVARGVVPLLREELGKIDIPLLELTGDPIDSRNYSLSQMETRIEAFIEVVNNKKEL